MRAASSTSKYNWRTDLRPKRSADLDIVRPGDLPIGVYIPCGHAGVIYSPNPFDGFLSYGISAFSSCVYLVH